MRITTLLCFLALLCTPVLSPAATDGRSAAVKELFKALDLQKMTDATILTNAEIMARQTDYPEKAKPRLEKFLRETVGYKMIEPDMVALYEKHFTESEIDDLLKFYKSATGRKLSQVQLALYQEGAAIGQAKMLGRQAELEKILKEYRK